MKLSDHRDIPKAKRIVVKVGSSSITGANQNNLDLLVEAIAKATANGQEIVLVTSGAIATGLPLLNFTEKPTDLATKQALASVGQSKLMGRYETSLERVGGVGAGEAGHRQDGGGGQGLQTRKQHARFSFRVKKRIAAL